MIKILFLILLHLIIGTELTLAQTNLSPCLAATAQTVGTFCHGLNAINSNPAYLSQPTNDTMDTIYHINVISTVSSQASDSLAAKMNEIFCLDASYVQLNTIVQDTSFLVLIDNIENLADAQIFLTQLITLGYESAYIETTLASFDDIKQIKKQSLGQMYLIDIQKDKRVHLEYLNLGVMLANSSVDANWINTYILNGTELEELDHSTRNDIISVFPADGWQLNPLINYKFGLHIKNFALQVAPYAYGKLIIPKGLLELAFIGNELSKPIDFSGQKNQFQAVIPFSTSYVMKLNIPFLNNFSDRSYLGISAKYLAGLAYFETAFDSFSIIPDSNQVSVEANIRTKYNLAGTYMKIDSVEAFNYSFNSDNEKQIPAGSGCAFDFGLIMNINDKLSTSISITNLLGHITWGDNTSYEHELKIKSQFAVKEDIQQNLDSLLQQGIEIDSNISITSFKTKYPSTLILGTEYSIDKIKLASNLKFGFSDELGSSTKPRLSFASEIKLSTWSSLLGGISIGGYEGFQWGSGWSMKWNFLQCYFAYSEYGGIMNKAKGFSLSASSAFIF